MSWLDHEGWIVAHDFDVAILNIFNLLLYVGIYGQVCCRLLVQDQSLQLGALLLLSFHVGNLLDQSSHGGVILVVAWVVPV